MFMTVWVQLCRAPAAAAMGCSDHSGFPCLQLRKGQAVFLLKSETQLPLFCAGEWDLALCLHIHALLKSN